MALTYVKIRHTLSVMVSTALKKVIGALPHQRRELTAHEQLMGRRMLASVQGAPQFTATVDVCVDTLIALKASITPKISLTPLILKCVADVLPDYPVLNAALDGDELFTFERINLGVAMDTPFGLRVPVIHESTRLNRLRSRLVWRSCRPRPARTGWRYVICLRARLRSATWGCSTWHISRRS